MKYFFLATLAFSQTGSDTSVTGSSNACSTALNASTTAITTACVGLALPTNASIDSIIASAAELYSKLDKFCAPACATAFQKLYSDYSSVCKTEIIASNLTGSVIGSTFAVVGAVACQKSSNNTFCLYQQGETVAPILQKADLSQPITLVSQLAPLLRNTSFVCTECFQKQLEAIKNMLTTLDKLFQDNFGLVSNSTSNCPNLAPPGRSSASGSSVPWLFVAIALFSSLF